jgi:hypothetical protein
MPGRTDLAFVMTIPTGGVFRRGFTVNQPTIFMPSRLKFHAVSIWTSQPTVEMPKASELCETLLVPLSRNSPSQKVPPRKMPSGRTLRLVADSPTAAQMASSETNMEGPSAPEPSPIAVVADEGVTSSGPRVANDATLDRPAESEANDAPQDLGEPEGPASAPRAKTVTIVETTPIPANEPPPADPTEIPADQASIVPDEVAHDAPAKPLLASEALMEDLAPLEPSRDVARFWCAALGVGFAALGALPLVGLRPGGTLTAGLSFFLGGVALVAALTRVTYRQRAIAMLVLGLLVVLTGLGGTGPAAFIAHDAPGLGLARAFAATALPGALLFRAHYRAYAGARWLLGAAFVVALPFVALLAWRLATHEPDLSTAGSIVALVVTLVGLVGFMGKETTGAGTYVGLSVLVGLGAELFFSDLSYPGTLDAWSSIFMTALGSTAFVAATGLSALGLFQLLASRLSVDARRIDLHAATPEPVRARSNKSEWTA